MPSKVITQEIKQKVVKYYLSKPMTIENVAKKFSYCNPTISKILNEFNITRYKKAQVYSPDMEEHYFQNIDSEAKAYFLGFIIADGNVLGSKSDGSNRQCSVSICQNKEDDYILELFKKETKTNTNISNDGRGTSMIAIRSNAMADDLKKYGIVPNKTLISQLPVLPKQELMKHLIRGILDGDGSITSVELGYGNKHKHAISFCGTHQLMESISNYISIELNVNPAKVYDYQDKHLSEIKWQSIEDVNRIGNWLYEDATIYLSRKRDIFVNFQNHYNL